MSKNHSILPSNDRTHTAIVKTHLCGAIKPARCQDLAKPQLQAIKSCQLPCLAISNNSPCQPRLTRSIEHKGARCVSASSPFLLLFLQGHFYSALVAWSALSSEIGQEVGDVIPGMSVQASPQAFLVKVMGDQADASS